MRIVIFHFFLVFIIISLTCYFETSKTHTPSLIAFLYNPFLLRWDLMNVTNTNLCNLTESKTSLKGNSTKRDLIITSAFNKISGSLPFVMSLRAAGCKASLVIIAGIEIKKYKEYISEIESYGCQFIYINIDIPNKKDVFYYRHQLYYQFFTYNRDKIDRVLHADLFDTIFQHDPFIADGKSLILTNAYLKLSTNKWNQDAIKECVDVIDKIIPYKGDHIALYNEIIGNNHSNINAGNSYGSIDIMIDLENTMRRIGKGKKAFADDQGCLQMFVYMNYFNFSIIFDKGDLGYLSSIRAYAGNLRGELGNIIIGNSIPAVLHQYDQHPYILRQVHNKCPNIKNFKKFTRL